MEESEPSRGVSASWEPVPSYWRFVQESVEFLNKNRPAETDKEVPLNFQTSHLVYVLIGAVIWTALRARLNEHVTKPLSRRFSLGLRRQEDLQVNLWALLYNVGAGPLLFYSVVFRHEIFQKPSTVWEGCCGEVETTWDISVNYLLWSSYEVHLLYALYFIEDLASDTLLYTVHHGVTLALLVLSHSLGYHKIGLLVLSLLETTNIPLKLMKCLSAFRFQGDKELRVITKLCTTVLYIFGFSWFLFRLHWYPLKAVYAAENIPKRLLLTTSLRYQYYCVVMLQFLLLLNIFWFILVLKLILKVTLGKPPKKHQS